VFGPEGVEWLRGSDLVSPTKHPQLGMDFVGPTLLTSVFSAVYSTVVQ